MVLEEWGWSCCAGGKKPAPQATVKVSVLYHDSYKMYSN